MLAARECERKLRITSAGGEWQRKAAAEPRVDVREVVRPVGLAEALDVRRPDELELLGDVAGQLDQLLVANAHPFDRLAALRLDHRARDRVETTTFEVAEHVDRKLLATEARLHDRVDGRVAEE